MAGFIAVAVGLAVGVLLFASNKIKETLQV